MNWHDSGGAAFPIPHSNEPSAPCAEHGMTLRDYFAGQALAGMVEEPGAERMAAWAYRLADAMLAAREVQS